MIPGLAADVVLLVHAAFVAFVALGGFLVLRWRRVAWLHVPCALYGAAIEFFGWTCPLTPLEARLRRSAGEAGYTGSFLEHYLQPVLYPADWEQLHLWLGAAVLVGNGLVYGWILWRSRRRARRTEEGGEGGGGAATG